MNKSLIFKFGITKTIFAFCLISVALPELNAQVKPTDVKFSDSITSELIKEKQLDSLVDFYHKMSIDFYRKKDYLSAIKFAKKEVDIGLKVLDSLAYKNAIFNLGLFYYRNGNYYQAIEAYQKVIDSFNLDKKTLQSYCELGRSYQKLGDFHQALIYFEKGVSQPKYFSNKELVINYTNLSDFYDTYDTNIANFLKKKLKLLHRVDSLNDFIVGNDFGVIDNEIDFGNYYSNEEVLDVKKARYHFKKALTKALEIKDTFSIVKINNNLSYLYNLIQNDSSLIYATKGIMFAKADDPILVKLYNNLGEYYNNKSDFDEAIKYVNKELSLLLPHTSDTNYEYIPSFDALSLSQDKIHTIFTLRNKALYHLKKYKKHEKRRDLNISHNILMLADQLIDEVKKESSVTQTRLFWQQEASHVYMMAIHTCYLLNDINKAFYFMEKKKAVLLLENLSDKELRENINLPDSIIEKELSIKKAISSIENNLYNAKTNNVDSLSSALNSLKIKHTNFLKALQTEYKDYYDSKMPSEIISLEDIQKTLDSHTQILEYVMNKTDSYVLSITQDNVELFHLKNTKDLIEKISRFNQLTSSPFSTNKDKQLYNILAIELHNILIPKTVDETKKLIIIPDYNLQVLSFEALKPNNKSKDFLINNCEISYAYSLSFLNQNSKVKRTSELDIVGFAPINFNNGLTSLNHTTIEINTLKKLISGNYYLDSLATKKHFIDGIYNSKIIHLATHSNANDSISPWIAFKNEKIFLNELYNTQNNAQLVTLSACNTAIGQIKEGEGVFSLARGFFHSGANSVASTLWTANDKSTTFIIEEFYKNLKKGQTKSKALQMAKLKYLETHSLSETSPYYWASFVLIGDTSSIDLDNGLSTLQWTIIGFLILVTLLILFIKKLKK
ncbi:MAG: CHAT domain-containing protein [Winogradskyella sp.]|uniref:CHAT domain-containing protein n=1 Tax=Winogradskyella sp. TaxID=1883156 RepID=UPI0038590A32